ncbi:hypothetical protein C1646_678393, partial [Rhizophagus diaphanus]
LLRSLEVFSNFFTSRENYVNRIPGLSFKSLDEYFKCEVEQKNKMVSNRYRRYNRTHTKVELKNRDFWESNMPNFMYQVVSANDLAAKALQKLLIHTVREHDFSAQETYHHL